MKVTIKILAVISGFVFLLSGLGKMLDATAFGELIVQYGFSYASILAPVIIFSEIIVGLFLILSIYPKQTALCSIVMLIGFTATFFYAHIFQGVTDCGCFGSISFLSQSPPYITYIRNLILLALLIFVYLKSSFQEVTLGYFEKTTIIFISLVSAFVIGLTFSLPSSFGKQEHSLLQKPIKETALNNYIQTSPDSTYTFFIFSYDCKGCWDAIENLKKYNSPEVSDRLIGLAVNQDKNNRFNNFFNVDFEIKNIDAREIASSVEILPTFLYVQNDTIRYVIEEHVPTVYYFKKHYLGIELE